MKSAEANETAIGNLGLCNIILCPSCLLIAGHTILTAYVFTSMEPTNYAAWRIWANRLNLGDRLPASSVVRMSQKYTFIKLPDLDT